MVKLAFCDDDISVLGDIRAFLDRYREEKNRDIRYTAFCSSVELLEEIERGMRFDVLILDVLMPGQNGIEAAAEIRERDSGVKIIFLTSSAEFAVQSYQVDAHFYQLKPLRWDSFSRVMDSALEKCGPEREQRLLLRCRGGLSSISLGHLEYCEVIHRTLMIHLSSGKVLESSGSLDELESRLEPFGCFLRVHRSYMVNMDYVRSISYRAVVLSSLTEIPVPRGKCGEIKEAFMAYAFRNGQVGL